LILDSVDAKRQAILVGRAQDLEATEALKAWIPLQTRRSAERPGQPKVTGSNPVGRAPRISRNRLHIARRG